MDHNTSHTTTVPKDEARPPMVFLGFVLLGIFTLIILGWLRFGDFTKAWPGVTELQVFSFLGTLWTLAILANFKHRQANTAEHNLALNAKKHDTESFDSAIEQLGHHESPVRVSAVHTLGALAKASASRHGQIFGPSAPTSAKKPRLLKMMGSQEHSKHTG